MQEEKGESFHVLSPCFRTSSFLFRLQPSRQLLCLFCCLFRCSIQPPFAADLVEQQDDASLFLPHSCTERKCCSSLSATVRQIESPCSIPSHASQLSISSNCKSSACSSPDKEICLPKSPWAIFVKSRNYKLLHLPGIWQNRFCFFNFTLFLMRFFRRTLQIILYASCTGRNIQQDKKCHQHSNYFLISHHKTSSPCLSMIHPFLSFYHNNRSNSIIFYRNFLLHS